MGYGSRAEVSSTARRLGLRPLVLVFGLSVAFLWGKTTAGVNISDSRKIGIWRGKEGATVRRLDGSTYRLSTNCAGLWVASRDFAVQNHCRPSYFRFAKNRKLVPERGVDGPTIRPSTNCADVWIASRDFAGQNYCRPSYFRSAKNRKLVPERGLEPPTNCLRSKAFLPFKSTIQAYVYRSKNNPKLILNAVFFWSNIYRAVASFLMEPKAFFNDVVSVRPYLACKF